MAAYRMSANFLCSAFLRIKCGMPSFRICSRSLVYLSKSNRHSSLCKTSLFCEYPYSTNALSAETIDVNVEVPEVPYPPIKPRYPAGRWKDFDEKSAWKLHDYAHTILAIPRVKERLEHLAGKDPQGMWLVEALDPRPRSLDFKKIVTKTHLADGFPEMYKNVDIERTFDQVKSVLSDLIAQESEYIFQKKVDNEEASQDDYNSHKLLGSILRTLVTRLSSSNEHLLRSEIDEDVRIESFWHMRGIQGKGEQAGDDKDELAGGDKGELAGECLMRKRKKKPAIVKFQYRLEGSEWKDLKEKDGEKNADIITFQYRHKANWQLRTELPLPEFLPIMDPLCNVTLPVELDYSPDRAGVTSVKDRPTSISGHWIGNPCEFSLGSIHVMPADHVNKMKKLGQKYLDEAEVSFGLTAAFGSCIAQAHNQGFCDLLDVTYPITTQCITVNGPMLRFVAYQLNTLQLWNDANPHCNVAWISEPMKMYDSIEDGRVEGFNEDTFKMFTKFLLHQPVDRRINLRPYLPDEQSPMNKDLFINMKGDEPFEHEKIGRWQYPRKPVYF